MMFQRKNYILIFLLISCGQKRKELEELALFIEEQPGVVVCMPAMVKVIYNQDMIILCCLLDHEHN